MDFIQQLGDVALASRLRRIADRLSQDVTLMYKDAKIDFEPRWFTVYALLKDRGPLSVMEIASALGISHPAVNQIASEMSRQGMLDAVTDSQDKRRRMLSLSEKAHSLWSKLNPLLEDVDKAARSLTAENGLDVLAMLDRLERSLDQASLYQRIQQAKLARMDAQVEILSYSPALKPYFKSLNQAWIEALFHMEPSDEKVLGDPETHILLPGGHVFFARYQNEIVGTCALIKLHDQAFELGKMAVREDCRGQKIGAHLLARAIEVATANGATELILETNSKLAPALRLYHHFGFVRIPFEHPSPYARSDTRMKLDLQPAPCQMVAAL